MGAAQANPVHITVYMSPDPLAAELEPAFEAKYGDVLDMVGGPWCRRMRSEMEAGDIKADVTYGAEPPLYMMLRDEDQLMPYISSEVTALKPEYIPGCIMGGGYFTLANGRYAVIVYNKKLVEPGDVPTKWDDLIDPKWKGKVAIPDATLSATAFAMTCGLVQIHNWDFFRKLKENEAMLVGKCVDVPTKVASGEAWVGIAVTDGVLRMIKKAKKEGVESPLEMVWPEEGAVSVPRPIAIIKDEGRSEESTELAKKFLDFVLSVQGQKIATKQGFITVREALPLPEGVPAEIISMEVDWEWAHQNEEVLRSMFESIFYE
jgi:iron(III) transport system substrate-binding protein